MKTIKTLTTDKALPFDKLICNTPELHGVPSGRKVRLTGPLDMALKACVWRANLREVQLNKKGYDRGGAYWGNSMDGGPLYVAHAVLVTSELKAMGYGVKDEEVISVSSDRTLFIDYLRGSREDVEAQLRERYPFVQFKGV